MTPKEKAIELVNKMDGYIHYALIAVDEVIGYGYKPEFPYKYWEEVKQEIENL
jgi:hypothetical protein